MLRLVLCLLLFLLAACSQQPQPSPETNETNVAEEIQSFVFSPDSSGLSAQATVPSGRLVLTLGLNPETGGTGTFGRSALYWYGPRGSRLNGTVNLKLVSRNNLTQFVTANDLTVNAGTINTFNTPVMSKPNAPFCLEATFALTSTTGQTFTTAQPLQLCHRKKGEVAVSTLRIESASPTSGPVPFVFNEAQLLNFNVINTGTSAVTSAVRVNVVLPEGLSYVGTDPNIFHCVATGQLIECTTTAANLFVGVRSLPIRVVATERCAPENCEALAFVGQRKYSDKVEAFITGVANSTFGTDIHADAALTVAAADLSGIANESMNVVVNLSNREQTPRSNVVVQLENPALEFVSGGSAEFACAQDGGSGLISCQANGSLPVGSYQIPLVLRSAEVVHLGDANSVMRMRTFAGAGEQWNAATANLATEACVTFPDANLEAAVREALAIPTERMCADDMETLLELDAFFADISNLSGLEYAANLVSLDLGDNAITDISVLDALNNLGELDLSLNPITDLSALSAMNALTSLNLYSTDVSDLSVLSALTGLEELNLSFTDITDISALATLTNLDELDLSDNFLADMTALSSLSNLTELDLSFTEISDLSPLSGLTGLETLNLSDNGLTSVLALSTLTSLEDLNLSENLLTDLSGLSTLVNLELLDLSYNDILDLTPLTPLEELGVLDLEDSSITDIQPLVDNPGLGEGDFIGLRDNPLDVSEGSEASLDIAELEARGAFVDR